MVSSNFAFLPTEFRAIAESATKAEGHIMGDPRAACFHARFTLEAIVHWLYRHDAALRMPYDQSLGALLHEPCFQNLLPQAVFQKARVIQKVGNQAVHSARPIRQYDALQVVKELHHVCYWLVRTYTPDASREGAGVEGRARAAGSGQPARWSPARNWRPWKSSWPSRTRRPSSGSRSGTNSMPSCRPCASNSPRSAPPPKQQPDTHDYSEAETRRYLIDVELHRAGWPLDRPATGNTRSPGCPTPQGIGYADYVLWGDDGKPLAVVEAKKTTADPQVGQQQAKLYADCLEQMHGQRPIIFYTNGYTTWLWDDTAYPPRQVAGFYKKDELARLILRRSAARSAGRGRGEGRHRRALLPEAGHRQHLRAVHRAPAARPCW